MEGTYNLPPLIYEHIQNHGSQVEPLKQWDDERLLLVAEELSMPGKAQELEGT